MKRITALLIGIALLAAPVLAQDTANTATLNGLSVTYPSSYATSVVGTQFVGDPLTEMYPGGPQPAYTELLLFTDYPAPQSMYESAGSIRQYHVADAAGYDFTQAQIDALRALLAERPDLNAFMQASPNEATSLPFLPTFPAGQALRARAEYVDTPALTGIRYVTVYRQDVSPFLAGEFFYTFQGLTADGSTYVSAVFPVTAPGFPTEYPADLDYDAFAAGYDAYVAESVAALNAADAAAFVPALPTLDSIIQTISVGQ